MTITAWTGPLVTFPDASGGGANGNPENGPCAFSHGFGITDNRDLYRYYPGYDQAYLWAAVSNIPLIDVVPSTISATNLATSQSPAAGAITLTAGTGVTGSTSITNASTGATVTGLYALDGSATYVGFGQSPFAMRAWDPTTMLSRNVRLTSGGNDSGITFTVSGYDVFGFPMTETITGANAGVASGAKAFKYISGVTHTGTVAGTLTIGTGDVFGFPMQMLRQPFTTIWWGSPQTLMTGAAGTFTAPVTTTATATTGDVRGTFAPSTASDATKRLTVFGSFLPNQLAASNGAASQYGVVQA